MNRDKRRSMKRNIYIVINCIVIFLSFFFLLKIAVFDSVSGVSLQSARIWNALIVVLLFLVIHSIKLIRFYLILMENKIGLKRFIRIYIKTTFINMTLPYKSGELFRMYCFGHEFQNYKIGILGVLTDRFFDTCALLTILIPFEIILLRRFSPVTFLLFAFLLAAVAAYLLFPSTYRYINRFMILNKSSKKVIRTLQILEEVNEWYDYAGHLLKGRAALVFLLSCFSWTLELVILKVISGIFSMEYSIDAFDAYINSTFSGNSDYLVRVYVLLGATVFALTTLHIYGASFIRMRKRI